MHGQRGANFEHISKGLTDRPTKLYITLFRSVLNGHRENSLWQEYVSLPFPCVYVYIYVLSKKKKWPQIDLKGVLCRLHHQQHLPEQWQSIYYGVSRLNESRWRWPEVIQHQIQVRGQRWQQLKWQGEGQRNSALLLLLLNVRKVDFMVQLTLLRGYSVAWKEGMPQRILLISIFCNRKVVC